LLVSEEDTVTVGQEIAKIEPGTKGDAQGKKSSGQEDKRQPSPSEEPPSSKPEKESSPPPEPKPEKKEQKKKEPEPPQPEKPETREKATSQPQKQQQPSESDTPKTPGSRGERRVCHHPIFYIDIPLNPL
jgi:2-oxoglutarate dehydrogenase E2 component (dihydrolipoamide succinyltransferase)